MSNATAVVDCELVDVAHDARITIDDEFASLIPPLAAEERLELEASLVAHGGARDPIIVWDRGELLPPILLDGHNRLEICWRLGLPYAVKGIRFESKDQALAWMEQNQLGRRNLSGPVFTLMLGRLYNRQKGPVGGKGTAGQRTRERLAREHGVDPRTVDRAGAFQAAAEKLGVERDISAGRLRVSAPQLVTAAKRLPKNPPKPEVAAAIRNAKGFKGSRNREERKRRHSQTWLTPAEPTDCLKAIRFYAKTFAVQSPESIDALRALLAALLEENGTR